MLRWLAPVTALAVVVAVGTVDGWWTGRWVDWDDQTVSAAHFASVATEVGDWTAKDFTIDEQQITRGGYDGYLARTYQHRYLDGKKLTVVLIWGRPGPISVHTPDVCYGGIGYEKVAKETRVPFEGDQGGSGHQFFLATFARPSAAQTDQFRIYWGYHAGLGWQAPDYPRVTFATERLLYKLYVLQSGGGPDAAADGKLTQEFVRALATKLDQKLNAKL